MLLLHEKRDQSHQSIAPAWFYCVLRPPFTTSPRPQMASFTCLYFSPADTFLISLKLNLDGHSLFFSPSFFYICMHTKSTTQYITPRESTLLVTQSLMVLSPSKRLSFHPQSNSGYGNGNICSVSSSLVSILKVSNPIY